MSVALHNDSPRGFPYIWVTWLTGLLSGENRCEWAAWYKAHFRYAKRPRDNGEEDLEQWRRDHDEMVKARVTALREVGDTVTVEEQNAFKLKGSCALLSGQPDIIADAVNGALRVIDEKSGEPKQEHAWQVRTYQYALPYVVPAYKRRTLTGVIEYRGHSVVLDYIETDTAALIVDAIKRTGGAAELARHPSIKECDRCDILRCPDRIETQRYEAETSEW